ncbi:MAG: BlaI/MecI/CopY family transcriptional regulator [Opitutales bacterium]
MKNHHSLSRRETQIMDLLYAEGELTVNGIQERLPDPPTPMSIRTFLSILDEKGLVKRRKEGRGFAYSPKAPRTRAGSRNMRKVIQTFFDGSIAKAIGACLADNRTRLTPEERQRLHRLIDETDKRE